MENSNGRDQGLWRGVKGENVVEKFSILAILSILSQITENTKVYCRRHKITICNIYKYLICVHHDLILVYRFSCMKKKNKCANPTLQNILRSQQLQEKKTKIFSQIQTKRLDVNCASNSHYLNIINFITDHLSFFLVCQVFIFQTSIFLVLIKIF